LESGKSVDEEFRALLRGPGVDYFEEDGAKFAHVMGYFSELSCCRPVGMAGALPITHQEILAWCALTGIRLTRLELEVLRELDRLFLEGLREDD
jgi:hypothetical protein